VDLKLLMPHVAKVTTSWVKVACGRNHTLFRKIEGIYVQQVMWHNQTEQVMRPYSPQRWSRHWQSKCTPLIHRLRSCQWEWTIPRSGKGLRIHCANLSTPLVRVMSLGQNLRKVIPQWEHVRHVVDKVTTINIVVSCTSPCIEITNQ
jgi:hypothetical protein